MFLVVTEIEDTVKQLLAFKRLPHLINTALHVVALFLDFVGGSPQMLFDLPLHLPVAEAWLGGFKRSWLKDK